ncbi:hypothetical protein CDAR_59871 [Caerostris darwini]|uniref:Uncharacterized protein n=1 Tax=Caerostris darwini TaxID=1538125 RepID=A0AAV4RS36_9ARAC|nr:hypothetical protein CDAR_59871 [Caerostris darwini]
MYYIIQFFTHPNPAAGCRGISGVEKTATRMPQLCSGDRWACRGPLMRRGAWSGCSHESVRHVTSHPMHAPPYISAALTLRCRYSDHPSSHPIASTLLP